MGRTVAPAADPIRIDRSPISRRDPIRVTPGSVLIPTLPVGPEAGPIGGEVGAQAAAPAKGTTLASSGNPRRVGGRRASAGLSRPGARSDNP